MPSSRPTDDDDVDVGVDVSPPTPPFTSGDCLVGTPAEGPLREFLGRYSHRDWAREQLAEPASRAAIEYLRLGSPVPFPSHVLQAVGTHVAPSEAEVLSLARKGAIFTDDDGVDLLVRRRSAAPAPASGRPGGHHARLLGDEPTRIYVPLLIRPWVMQACHTDVSCHLGTTRTLRMLERFYWWIGMDQSTRWWLRRCLKCQARKSSRQTVRWPTLSMPLPNGPGEVVSFDYFGPLPVTALGSAYILLFTDRFSRHASMHAVTAAEFTAVGTARILVDQYMIRWGCPIQLLSDNGKQFCADVSKEVYRLMGIRKLTTSAYHPSGNGGVERVNHTMAQMLSMMVNEKQNDWDEHLPYIEFAYNNSVSAATGLAPNEVHLGRLPRLPLTIFERSNVGGHQSLNRDQLDYCNLIRDRQQQAYDLVREQNAITASRIARSNTALDDVLHKRPVWRIGDWVWIYNSESTIRQGSSRKTEDKILKAKLSLNWTGPFKILAVGPAKSAPDGRPVGDKLLYLDLPSDLPGQDAKRRVSVARCKPCFNPHDDSDMPQYLPAGLTQYVLNKHSEKSPPYHVTHDDIAEHFERVEVDKITAHQAVRGRGGKIAVMYETHWKGILRVSWERETDLHHFRRAILLYWAHLPLQKRQVNSRYRSIRRGAAARELHRSLGERFVANGYGLVNRAQWTRQFKDNHLPKGAYLWYKGGDDLWWLGRVSELFPTDNRSYIIRFLDDPGPVKITLQDERYTAVPSAGRGSWCLQTHLKHGVQRNVDSSREQDLDSDPFGF